MANYVITFACMPGTGKSSLASYLSTELKLPIFSNDAIRNEVRQDQDVSSELDVKEFEKRRSERFSKLLNSNSSFIYDASVDRRWPELAKEFELAGYKVFVISFDLSKDFAKKLYDASPNPKDHFEGYLGDHQNFLDHFSGAVSLSIDDSSYASRREESLKKVKQFVNG